MTVGDKRQIEPRQQPLDGDVVGLGYAFGRHNEIILRNQLEGDEALIRRNIGRNNDIKAAALEVLKHLRDQSAESFKNRHARYERRLDRRRRIACRHLRNAEAKRTNTALAQRFDSA